MSDNKSDPKSNNSKNQKQNEALLLKQKQEEELQKQKEEELKRKKEIQDRIEQLNQSIQENHEKLKEFYKDKENKRKQREETIINATKRPTQSELKQYNSGLKRNTALFKKLKQGITDANINNLCKEIPQLNLSRYVSEVVATIIDFKPKTSINATARVCILMHCRYSEFTDLLIPQLEKNCETPSSFDNEQDKKAFYSRKKEIIKLLIELYLVGIYSDHSIIRSIIEYSIKETIDNFKDHNLCSYGLIIQISWARASAHEFMGIYPQCFYQILKNQQQLEDLKESLNQEENNLDNKNKKDDNNDDTIDNNNDNNSNNDNEDDNDKKLEELAKLAQEQRQEDLENHVKTIDTCESLIDKDSQEYYYKITCDYFNKMSEYMIKIHRKLRKTEYNNQNTLNIKGKLSDECSQAYEKQLNTHDKLLNNLHTLASLLHLTVPPMPEVDRTTRMASTIGLADLSRLQAQNEEEGIFGDEDTRSFYEDLRCLRDLLPAVFFSETTKTPSNDTNPKLIQSDDKITDNNENTTDTQSNDNITKDTTNIDDNKDTNNTNNDKNDKNDNDNDDNDDNDKNDNNDNNDNNDTIDDIDIEDIDNILSPKSAKFDAFIKELPQCVNRELIDEAAINFCYISTKNLRKKLASFLFNVSRNELVLLPYYSRLVATLDQVYPEITLSLTNALQKEFTHLVKRKDQTNVESKIKNVRFIGELTKFKILPPHIALSCLHTCLNDFSHHNIDMACNLFESCGRFLYRTPETHIRLSKLLETMMRFKNAKNLDSRMETIIENAYYYCKPPENSFKKKERPPIHEYIRYLIFNVLSKLTLKNVLRKICKLKWDEHGDYLIKCLLNLKNNSYSNISNIANLIASFNMYNPQIGVKVIDLALYQFYSGLENDKILQQHRVMNIKFIGELYAYCIVDSPMIFNLLYTLITYPCKANHSFRIRLVCTMISLCSPFFTSPANKRKFARFLVYFQCYYFTISFIPYDVEFMMADTLGSLPKQFKRLTTPDEAKLALQKVRKANAERNIVPFSIDRLQISFKGSVDDIEEDTGELEAASQIIPESQKQKQKSNSQLPTQNEKDHVDEDAEFDQMFNNIVRESISSHKAESQNNLTMAVPMNLYRSSNSSNTKENSGPTKSFRVLMKKGNKQTTCILEVPTESPFANKGRDKEWEKEQQLVKQKVLEYEVTQEEEEDLINDNSIPYDIKHKKDSLNPKKPYWKSNTSQQ